MRWRASASVLGLAAVTIAASATANEVHTFGYDALGRLISAQVSGTVNAGQAHSICYDPAGNRSQYKTSSSGALAPCIPTPAPTPTPTGTNQPPTAVADQLSLRCYTDGLVNLLLNDTDPDGNVPLVLQSIARVSGTATASISGSSAAVSANDKVTSIFNYIVTDSLGATAQGQLTVTAMGPDTVCGGGSGTNSVPEGTTDGGDGTDNSVDVTDPDNTTDPGNGMDVPGGVR